MWGGYDLIVEGQYRITQSDNGKTILRLSKDKYLSSFERMFDNLSLEFGYDVKDIRFLEAYLFLTMIPLHCESINKMKCFLLTALYKLQKCMQEDDDANLY